MTDELRRPPESNRRFRSPAIERAIEHVRRQIADPELSWLFGNCFPNTLDTTVAYCRDEAGRDDAFVITGDIDAMWLRDSTAQVWPYLPFVSQDPGLQAMIRGLINRQAACVLLDPYANAYTPGADVVGHWHTDHTDVRPGVYERKYELDSLCAVLRLAMGYYKASGDATCFDDRWRAAVELILETIAVEQRGSDEDPGSPYHFARTTRRGTDTQPLAGGHTYPVRRTGLSRSPFRPSDDACQFGFPIAANAMAVVCLRELAQVAQALGLPSATARRAAALADEIDAGIRAYGIHDHPVHGKIFAYEVDGFGSRVFLDDANVPSLLSLPYLGYCSAEDPLYLRTRRFVLSADNPFYAEGRAGRGVGGPHVGPGWIWPMAITMQALTSTDDGEIRQCLDQLKASHAGTGFMHETFWKDDAARFTRSWFAWANTLFGELILTLSRRRPHLLAGK